MKKIVYIIASVLAIASVACSKQETTTEFVENHDPAHRTFMVDVQQTKTTIDGLAVKWAAGDKIRVYGYTKVGEDPASIGEAEFHIKSGVGSSSAVFEIEDGQSLGEFNTYYAVYPSTIQLKTESLPTNLEVSTSTPLDLDNQVIADGASYDPSFALMTAVYSESKLSFRHGVAYIKLQIPEDGITAAEVSFGANATGKRPIYTASTGEVNSVQGGYNKVKASGNLVKDNWYFLPVPARSSNPGDVTVAFYKGAVSSSKTTKSLTKTRLATGEVYNLGCPPVSFSPSITASDVDIAQDATGGNITFTIGNPAGDGVISIAETGGKTNPVDFVLNTTIQTDHFEFTCGKNAAADARKFYVTLTYSYNGGADETSKDVVITQDGSAKETHVWDFATYTDAKMTEITGLAADAKATAGQTWNFGDGLTMVTNGSSKWNNQTISGTDYKWVATGGKYGSGQKYFSFTTTHVGTITVLYTSGGAASRALTVKVGSSETTDSANVSTSTSDLKTVTFSSVAAGTVLLYSKDDNVRVFSISFLED